ncbi:hypothetical protein IMX26_14515 [Clostridium sp. 'deep sea']|uniref:hypothetical protein n=1 Tax=Clostridium sp. 'deep sea' TaxID=2779445 RepID=UPI0018965B4B|nr:hypothetical protein [Clostridium sp. 'deep sea']QOR34671.1 hypothetical protein IMX26_14515 [Clostridium sp. 'deep sea']
MSRSGRWVYSDQLELHHMKIHQDEDKRKRIFITAESYELEDIDIAELIARLKNGYESMSEINLLLATEAFFAETEVMQEFIYCHKLSEDNI